MERPPQYPTLLVSDDLQGVFQSLDWRTLEKRVVSKFIVRVHVLLCTDNNVCNRTIVFVTRQ